MLELFSMVLPTLHFVKLFCSFNDLLTTFCHLYVFSDHVYKLDAADISQVNVLGLDSFDCCCHL